MQRIHDHVKALRDAPFGRWMNRNPRKSEFIAVALFFGALAALFMGPILWNFNSAVHGFWGDGTGGIIWMQSLGLPPFGGMTDMANYPIGDDLFKPELVTSALYVVPFWILTKLFGAVAAWNTIVFVSFWLCGVSMYYLAKKVARSRLAAIWAGVAFAYLPMHQYKAFGHIAYVITFIFVFVLWQLLNFINNPTKRNAIFLGLLFAAQFYMDGYFVLFGLLLVGVPLVFVLVKYIWQLTRDTVEEFKRFLVGCMVFVGTAVAALLPIVYVKLVYGARIASSLAMSRGDFMANVKVYTARLYDFILPIETHPVVGGLVREIREVYNHDSNPSEYTLYLGVVLLGLVVWTVYYFFFRKDSKKDPALSLKRNTIIILLVTATVAFLISLPPFITVFGHRIPMPSGVISVLVQYWRVYARLVFIIDLLLVLVAAIGLAVWLTRTKKRQTRVLIVAILVFVTFFEYLSFNPFHRQDIWYYSRLSSTNQWLSQQEDIQVIAIYPLVDQPHPLASLYTTEQQVHGKKIINSGAVTQRGSRLRASIAGLNDPQTGAVLKALGAQAVMTHEVRGDHNVSWLELAYSAHETPVGYSADVELYRISDSVVPAEYALVADTGFTDIVTADLRSHHYINVQENAVLQVVALSPFADHQKVAISFSLISVNDLPSQDVIISQGSKVLDIVKVGEGDAHQLYYVVDPIQPITIAPVGGVPKSESLYIANLMAR